MDESTNDICSKYQNVIENLIFQFSQSFYDMRVRLQAKIKLVWKKHYKSNGEPFDVNILSEIEGKIVKMFDLNILMRDQVIKECVQISRDPEPIRDSEFLDPSIEIGNSSQCDHNLSNQKPELLQTDDSKRNLIMSEAIGIRGSISDFFSRTT